MEPTMQNSSPKFLRSLSLAPAGLASALVIVLLGTTVPRLAAQSDDFNSAPPPWRSLGEVRATLLWHADLLFSGG